MTDISMLPELPQIAPHVVHHAHHAAAVAKTVAPHIHHGVHMFTTLFIALTSATLTSAIAWYVSHRGLTGVKNDLNNAKAEITKITNTLNPPVITPVVTPAA